MTLRSKLLLAQLPLAISLVLVAVVSRGTVTSLEHHSQTILKDNHASVLGAQRMRESADERAVTDAGGLYRLKLAGADGLAEIIQDVATQPVSPAMPYAAPGLRSDASAADRRSRPARARTAASRSRSRCTD